MAKKLKKFLKKAGKAAAVAAALYGATKLGRKRETDAPGDAAAVSTGNAQSRFTTQGPDGTWRGPMEHKRYMAALPTFFNVFFHFLAIIFSLLVVSITYT